MSEVTARILLWGIEGSGKSTTLQTIHAKLRPDLRGDLRTEPTRLDPTVRYEALPIMLGQVGGVATQIEILAVPGSSDQAMTRKQLLDEIDGIVLTLDCSPERIEENWGAIDELRASLEDYGRSLEEIPIVLQYNKRDVADPFAIEDLHRRIGLEQAAVFETIATTGHGILATLTTISKHVVRTRRGQTAGPTASEAAAETPRKAEAVDANASSHDLLEAAILAEGELTGGAEESAPIGLELSPERIQPDWEAASNTRSEPGAKPGGDLRIVSVGQATSDAERGIRLPIVLGDEEGRTHSLMLSLRLDSLLDDGDD
jgi:signal recognition particle receptor subunit beta